MKIGTLYSYWGNEWDCDYLETARKVRAAGCDVLEVGAGHLLEKPMEMWRELRAMADDCGLTLTANIGPAKQYDVASSDPAVRAAGVAFLSDIMKRMAQLNIRNLVGVQYTYWPNDFSDLDKPAIWARGVESSKKLAAVAADCNVLICQEVVNRFETHILNTCAEGIAFCQEVGSENVKLLLDTFHMNIEEDNIPAAIRQAGSWLGQLHVGEGNRKLPGMGSLPWAEIVQALRDIGFDGNLVMEPFLLQGGQVGRDIKVWRDLSGGADEARLSEMLKTSVAFLRGLVQ